MNTHIQIQTKLRGGVPVLTLLAVLLLGIGRMAAQTVNLSSITYTWTDADGEDHTSKLTDKATNPSQILALLAEVYCNPDVPGFIDHTEYDETGKSRKADQWSQHTVNYSLQSRINYLYRQQDRATLASVTTPDEEPIMLAGNPFDRVSWIARKGDYGNYGGKSSTYNQYSSASTTDRSKSSRTYKKYSNQIPQPNVDGATILFVELKDSWTDHDIVNYHSVEPGSYGASLLKNTKANSRTRMPYAGYYYWNAYPGDVSNYVTPRDDQWESIPTNTVDAPYTSTDVYKGTKNTSYNHATDYSTYMYTLDYNYVKNAIKSIQVIDNTYRIEDDDNPGYLCIRPEVTSQRFFYLAKGRVRAGSFAPPFYQCFEQLSPTTKRSGVNPKDANSFGLISGKTMTEELTHWRVFDFQHDCHDVLRGDGWGIIYRQDDEKSVYCWQPHYAEVEDGRLDEIKNLCLFLPDKRFKYQAGVRDGMYYHQIPADSTVESGSGKYAAKMLLYLAKLEATATVSSKPGYFDIKLEWETTFGKEKLGTEVNEQFYVYAVTKDEDGNERLVQLDAFIGSDDGYESDAPVATTLNTDYTYRVLQLDDSQTFTYIITANPIDPESGVGSEIFINSNTASVLVPGKDQFLLDATEYRSRYDIDNELNLYRNTARISSNLDHNALVANEPEFYELYRVDEANDTKTKVATISFEYDSDDENGNHVYAYTVKYYVDLPNPRFDTETRVTTGKLRYPVLAPGESRYSSTDYYLDIRDYFNASTAENTQPTDYIYVMNRHDAQNTRASNQFDVPVKKTTNSVLMAPFTLDDVQADDDRHLSQSRVAEVTFGAKMSETLHAYDVKRKAGGDIAHIFSMTKDEAQPIADAERDGFLFNVKTYDYSASALVANGDEHLTETDLTEMTVSDNLDMAGVSDPKYVPYITTRISNLDGDVVENTYGCNFGDTYMQSFAISCGDELAEGTIKSDPSTCAYKTSVTLTPTLPAAIDGVYYYRVWRRIQEPDGTWGEWVLLNGLDNVANPDPRDEGQLFDVIKATSPGNDPLMFYDYFLHKKLGDGETLNVQYEGRMYTYKNAASPAASPARRRAPLANDATASYYMSESSDVSSFSRVVTGVRHITGAAQVVRVVYINGVGQSSARPWPGVNIERRTLADGTTLTVKSIH